MRYGDVAAITANSSRYEAADAVSLTFDSAESFEEELRDFLAVVAPR
jgi:hypothetical protein